MATADGTLSMGQWGHWEAGRCGFPSKAPLSCPNIRMVILLSSGKVPLEGPAEFGRREPHHLSLAALTFVLSFANTVAFRKGGN